MLKTNTVYVGIDFSINAPGVCIYSKLTNEYYFISFSNNDRSKLLQKKIPKSLQIYKELRDKGLASIIFYNRRKRHEDYTLDQYQKVQDALIMANLIVNTIDKFIGPDDTLFIGLEGYSYGSKGKSFIDLISFNSTLRAKIYEKYESKIRPDNQILYVYSPSQIKKLAGKGNANKKYMFDAWIENKLDDKCLSDHPFYKWNEDKEYGDNIPKPLDDLVDAYWITRYLIKEFS